ncbi:short chain dehydrogenase [mine drainage metagenome]|uniref:Short chain dehydrogenase n=1 Tax=mine drainage metagenome TaxID=410659 RepID=A0A1J5S6P8_9ZZZZ
MLENVATSLLVKRVGQAEDVADRVLLFLRNTFATRSVVYLDGGSLPV